MMNVLIDDYDYDLPAESIAHYPVPVRDESKLLRYKEREIEVDVFKNLAQHLPEHSTLVLNNTRVIEARILFQKKTGGMIELFCLEPAENINPNEALQVRNKTFWLCYIGGASKWKHGEILSKEIIIDKRSFMLAARFLGKKEDAFEIEFSWEPSEYTFAEVLHAAGSIPLPPYIKRKAEDADTERYQTIFAENSGSVAAPTAALHFTPQVFDELQKKNIKKQYITLHVGAGTFKPVKTKTIAEHHMHAERFEVSISTLQELRNATTLIAVGTTSLRTMESLYWLGIKILKGSFKSHQELVIGQWEAYELDADNISFQDSISAIINFLFKTNRERVVCETSLLIIPGYCFQSAKALITNFHQPRSTLLLLIAAFVGPDWKKIYEYALENRFRFLSYGDSSLLWRKD